MRINPTEKILGISIIKIRDFLRRAGNFNWGNEYVAKKLKITNKKAEDLIKILNSKGYIKHAQNYNKHKLWSISQKGITFSLASACKPVNRTTADKIFSMFMDRVKEINNTQDYLMKVKKVVLFGSYLSNCPKVNDIDVAVELVWKEDHPRVMNEDKYKLALDLALEAEKKGELFNTLFSRVNWPEKEIYLFLKSRSRTLSIHTIHDNILKKVEYKVVFVDKI